VAVRWSTSAGRDFQRNQHVHRRVGLLNVAEERSSKFRFMYRKWLRQSVMYRSLIRAFNLFDQGRWFANIDDTKRFIRSNAQCYFTFHTFQVFDVE
jgi:hypothetical protein